MAFIELEMALLRVRGTAKLEKPAVVCKLL